jgi:hypothetical protein
MYQALGPFPELGKKVYDVKEIQPLKKKRKKCSL